MCVCVSVTRFFLFCQTKRVVFNEKNEQIVQNFFFMHEKNKRKKKQRREKK